jgi:hypothetical protein
VTKNTFSSLGILVAAFATAAYSCSSSSTGLDTSGLGNPSSTTGGKGGTGTTTSGGSSSTGLTGSTAGGTTGTSGSSNASGGSANKLSIDAGQDDSSTGFDEDAACGTGEASAMLKQVDMFVMFDRSWSMNECGDGTTSPMTTNTLSCDTGPTRWELTSTALIKFFQSDQAADLGVALRFFPDDHPAVGCDGYPTTGGMFGGGMFGGGMFGTAGMSGVAGGTGTGAAGSPGAGPNCDTNACAQPLVDVAPLLADAAPVDAHEAALVAAVMAATPPGPEMPDPNPATPTSAALGGAEQWATQHQGTRTDLQTVVVLITDGEPYGCDTNITNISRLAGNAYNSAGILTYVIGLVGADATALNVLNQIADAGGTDEALFVDPGTTATDQLLQALIAIKGMALSCDLDVPKNDDRGMMIDPHLINVHYTSGGMEQELGFVDSLAACGTEPAWYFDDPTNPSKAILCPQTCSTIKTDTTAVLRILAGCKPHVVAK